jgi:hypothetical protein
MVRILRRHRQTERDGHAETGGRQMTDYNDGRWHAWDDGDVCPVHPKSTIQVVYNNDHRENHSVVLGWREQLAEKTAFGNQHIVAFRVVNPYVEPVEYTGECSAYHFTEQTPMLYDLPPRDDIIAGRFTATHINGKLARIVWEANE